jgi:hypothetical protein
LPHNFGRFRSEADIEVIAQVDWSGAFDPSGPTFHATSEHQFASASERKIMTSTARKAAPPI